MKFKVQITETLQRIVEVDAEDIDDVIAKVEWDHEQGEIVLDADDFVDVHFSIIEEDF